MTPAEILAEQGNCRGTDPSLMYPEPGDERAEGIARSVCDNCVVIDMCREEALSHHESGVWAGMTAEERSKLHRKIVRNERDRRREENAGVVS